MNAKDLAKKLQQYFACAEISSEVTGVNVLQVSENKYALPIEFKDGTTFGLTIEELVKK